MQEYAEAVHPTHVATRRIIALRFVAIVTVILGPLVGLLLAGIDARQLELRRWAATYFGGAAVAFGAYALLLMAGADLNALRDLSFASLLIAYPLAKQLRRLADADRTATAFPTRQACAVTAGIALLLFAALFAVGYAARVRHNSGPARVTSVVLTHAVEGGDAADNATRFDPTATVYALVKVDGTRHNPTVRMVWTLVASDDGQYSNVSLGGSFEQLGSHDGGMIAKLYPKQLSQPMESGLYQLAVYLDGALARTVTFTER